MTSPVALISSTIFPGDSEAYGTRRDLMPVECRLQQTQDSIASLQNLGINEIFLIDNSGKNWMAGTDGKLAPAKVVCHEHYQFRNKGISELYLLKAGLGLLPPDRAILKLSGRYTLERPLYEELGVFDLVARCYPRTQSIATNCYVVRNTEVYEALLSTSLRVLYGYASRIVGPRSLFRILRNSVAPAQDHSPYDDPSLSIEQAMGRALRMCRYSINCVDHLGVRGISGLTGEEHTE